MGMIRCFQKIFNFFFDPKNMKKKRPQKLLIISPQLFFMYWPGCPNGQETEIQYHQKPLNAGLGIQTGSYLMKH